MTHEQLRGWERGHGVSITSISPYRPQMTEEGERSGSQVALTGGSLQHAMDRRNGRAVVSSRDGGAPWIAEEMVVLEQALGRGGTPRWAEVGGLQGARVSEGASVRTVGGPAASCETTYTYSAEGALKVKFRIRAAEQGAYRLRWSLRGLRGAEAAGALGHGLRFADGGALLDIDWADVAQSHGPDVVSLTGSGENRDILFGPFTLAAGEEVLLDPLVNTLWDHHTYNWGSGRRVARGPDGRLYVVYAGISSQSPWKIQVYFQESADEGQTWSTPRRISTVAGQEAKDSRPGTIAVDSQGDVHIVYSGGSSSYFYEQIWYVRRAGDVWQDPVRICTVPGMTAEQTRPAITVDRDDNLHVAWHGSATGSDGIQIWWAACLDGVWQAPVRVSTGTGEHRSADITADADGGLHLTWSGPWYQGYYGYPQIWHAERVDGAWQAPVRISTAPGMEAERGAADPSIALTADGGVHVIWSGQSAAYHTNLQIWYAQRTTTWQEPVRLSTASGMQTVNQCCPSIAPDTAGRLHVLWEGSTAYPTKRLFRAIFDGAAWSAPILETPAYQNQRPSLRWSSLNNNGGCLDWVWLEAGTDIQFAPGYGALYELVTPTAWRGQTFTAIEPVRLRAMGVHVRNDGTPREVTLALYATDQGLPTGAPMVSFTGTIPDFGGAFGWLTFGFSEEQDVRLTAGNVYCLVLYPSVGTVHWHFPIGTYSGGNLLRSEDSGQTWTPDTDPDSTNDVGFGIYVQYNLQYTRDETAQPADAVEVPSGPLVSTVTYTYDAMGRVVAVEDPLGQLTTTSYDANGAVQEILDARGYRTTHSYDAAGRLAADQDALGYRTTYLYDDAGQRIAVWDARGNRTSYVYDRAGQLIAQVDAVGQRTSFSYDATGRQEGVTDPLGRITTSAYDAAGRLWAAVDPLGQRTTYHYDAASRRVAVEDALGHFTTTAYDAAGRLWSTQNALGSVTTYHYDGVGRQIALEDAQGHRTSFSYDPRGLQTELVDPLGRRTTFGYDGLGRQTWRLDAKQQPTTYVYDVADRLLRRQYPGGSRVMFSYDAVGNQLTMKDGTGTTSFSYDPRNALGSVVYPNGAALTYSYDAVRNRTEMIDSDGGATGYGYDPVNRTTWLLNPLAERTSFLYDGAGQRTGQQHANGTRVSYSYDAAGRLTQVVNLKSDSTTLSSFGYALDAVGNRTSVVEASGDRVTWSYDATSQLTREQRSGADAYDITYTYDAVGNRLTKLESGVTTYSYDAANQLGYEETPTARTTFSYDANGNMTVTDAGGSLTTSTWDFENMCVAIALPSGARNTFAYDGGLKRRSAEDSAGLARFVHDGENVLLETDAGGATQVSYTLEPAGYGNLISQRRGSASSWHHFDALGSTDRLTDAVESELACYVQTAFGVAKGTTGSHPNRLRWIGRLGHRWEPDTSHYDVRRRRYDPHRGRWGSCDVLQAPNRFAYAGNRPVVLVDPSGLAAESAKCPCGSKANPYSHLIFYWANDPMFANWATLQESNLRWSSNMPGIESWHKTFRSPLHGNQGLLDDITGHRCILSLSIMSHGGPGWISLGSTGQNIYLGWSGRVRSMTIEGTVLTSGIHPMEIPTRDFVACRDCVVPAQVMLYTCRSMLGVHHTHERPGVVNSNGEPKNLIEGHLGHTNDLVDLDHSWSIGAALARRFGVPSYGPTGGTADNGGFSRIVLNLSKPDNYWQGARWGTSDGATFTEYGAGQDAGRGTIVRDP